METYLIIDGNSVYEIDLECEQAKNMIEEVIRRDGQKPSDERTETTDRA